MLGCSYKVEGDEQTATAELRGLRVVTQINLGSAEPSAPTSEVCLQSEYLLAHQHCTPQYKWSCGSSLFGHCLSVLAQTQQISVIALAQLL